MAESADGGDVICPSTTECHNTLLATQPKVDDNGTPPFRHPLLLADSNWQKCYEWFPPLEDGDASKDDYYSKKSPMDLDIGGRPTTPGQQSTLHLHDANLVTIVSVYGW